MFLKSSGSKFTYIPSFNSEYVLKKSSKKQLEGFEKIYEDLIRHVEQQPEFIVEVSEMGHMRNITLKIANQLKSNLSELPESLAIVCIENGNIYPIIYGETCYIVYKGILPDGSRKNVVIFSDQDNVKTIADFEKAYNPKYGFPPIIQDTHAALVYLKNIPSQLNQNHIIDYLQELAINKYILGQEIAEIAEIQNSKVNLTVKVLANPINKRILNGKVFTSFD
jgi:hypothetical protein